MATIKGQVLADFVIEFLHCAVKLEQGCLVSAHRWEKSSGTKSDKIQSSREDPKVTKEPHWRIEATSTEEITEVPEVIIEPPQVDPIMNFLRYDKLSKDKREAHKLNSG